MADLIDELRADQAADVVDALYRIGEDLLGKAVDLAPLEEGTLRGSGMVTLIINGLRHDGAGTKPAAIARARSLAAQGFSVNAEVEVSFNTVYAARQHEETTWRHPLAGQAKYLEQPFRENLNRYQGLLELAAERAARRGGS